MGDVRWPQSQRPRRLRKSRSTHPCLPRSCRALLGIVLGMATPDFAISLKILSDAFLKLITMIVAPIVFCVVVHGIAGAGDLKKVGRVGVKALVYFEIMTTVALVVGLLLAYHVRPRPRHEHRHLKPRCQGARQLCRQGEEPQRRRRRQLPAEHHPDHLLRCAVAQRRIAGPVLRDHLRRQPGAGAAKRAKKSPP